MFCLSTILYTLSLISGSPASAQAVVDGGLTAPETGWSLGPNLLVNGDFSRARRDGISEHLLQHRSDHAGAQRRAPACELSNPAHL